MLAAPVMLLRIRSDRRKGWRRAPQSEWSSSGLHVAPGAGPTSAEPVECTEAEVHEAVGVFSVTCLAVESSSGDTPSHVYDGGRDVAVDMPSTPRVPCGKSTPLAFSSPHFSFSFLEGEM